MRIALLGDIALFGNISVKNNPSIGDYFSDVAYFLKKFDYVVGNLESPFSLAKKKKGAKSAYLCSDVEDVKVLKYLGVDAVTLANNHMFDYGKEGFETTKTVLNENGIAFFGTEGKQHKLIKDDNKIAFTGFCCYSTNPQQCVQNGNYGVNEYNLEKTKEILKENHKNGYLNIVAIHAGLEHVNYPSLDHIHAARQLARECTFIYYGHHPHVVQGVEKIDKSIIAYSLGNFCFDDVYASTSKKPILELSENNRSSYVLEIEIENNNILSYHTTPIYIGKDKIHVGKGTTEDMLKKYSAPLNELSVIEYEKLRNNEITTYFGKRISQRNLIWYLKRIRLRYIRLYISNKQNLKKYKECVSKFIKL